MVAEPDTFDSVLAPNADNAIPLELRDLLRSALAQATAKHRAGGRLPGIGF